MSQIKKLLLLICALNLQSCLTRGPNPADPYEAINRKIFTFNMAFDATVLKPPAKLYAKITPAPVRAGINNFYTNINMIPTVINDLLQMKYNYAIKDTWRFITNTTIGIGGIFDPAAKRFGLPPHSNDLGITFALWGDQHSPFVMIPFLGPSTVRDGMGMLFEYTFFTPYPYIRSSPTLYGLLGLRYVDLRAQMLDNDRILGEALDLYSFIRDAYIQHRQYLIHPEQNDTQDSGALYVDDDTAEKPTLSTPDTQTDFPLTTAENNRSSQTLKKV